MRRPKWPTTVAVIATGEMGSAVGRVLGKNGARVVTSLEGRSRRTASLASAADITDLGSLERAVSEANMFLSIVPPGCALSIATSVADCVQRTGKELIYIDFNAVSPRRAASIGEVVTDAGCDFVDGGIIGFPPQPGLPGARFWVSGPSVGKAMSLSDYGLDMRVAGAHIGQASAIKMSYAAITKGLTAIAMESLVSSLEADVYGPLIAELKSSQAALAEWLEHMLLTSPPKAYRWIAEMEEIADTIESTGWPDRIFRGAAAVFQRVAQTIPGRETPETRTGRQLDLLIEQIAHPDSNAAQ